MTDESLKYEARRMALYWTMQVVVLSCEALIPMGYGMGVGQESIK